ncbi:MAG: hypothetical protein ATN36_07695 [Epulopiscium sp. Nele67-Bin005]|nr:MAG: hypothetical protein ATN36_07695 [Epulopiscium sp. Nele67-Bin005]
MRENGRRGSGRSSSRRSSSRRQQNEPQNSGFGLAVMGMMLLGVLFYQSDDLKELANPLIQKGKNFFSEVQGEQRGIDEVYAMPCMQANIAKILVHTLYNDEVLESSSSGIWYNKYYEVLESKEKFNYLTVDLAMQPVTNELASQIISDVLGDDYTFNLALSEEMLAQSIAFESFLEMYYQALITIGQAENVVIKDISIVKTPASYSNLEPLTVLTDSGIYSFSGLILDPLTDYTLEVAMVGNEILGIMQMIDTKSILEECYISKIDGDTVWIQFGDNEIAYQNKKLTSEHEGSVINLKVEKGTIIDFVEYMAGTIDTVLRITDSYIEFADTGKFSYNSDVNITDYTSSGDWHSFLNVSSGAKVDYTLENEAVKALRIIEKPSSETVRVVITEDGLGDYFHSQVQIEALADCELTYNDQTFSFKKGDVWDSELFEWVDDQNKLVVNAVNDGLLQLNSITRSSANPSYTGSVEVYKDVNGYTVVNEVSMNDYLARVIPSEMPPSFGLEALKVQAISARSYAVSRQTSSQFVKYAAQLDDTTASQVYNNVEVDELAVKAIKETEGQVLKYNNNIVSGNFFSTSAGHTANSGEVWASGETFPTSTPIYLSANQQYEGSSVVENMQSEEDLMEFFQLAPSEIDAFDDHAAWFRWEVFYSVDELSHVVNNSIERLTGQYSHVVKVLDSENNWQIQTVDNIGAVLDIEITQRGEGGNIISIVVVGQDATVEVKTEYAIRTLFAPIQKDSAEPPIQIFRADGSTVDNMTLLPSAFFSPKINYGKDGNLLEVTFYGGGFGHGVGMSQEGVRGMVNRGYTYKEIIEHYYPNSIVEKL